MTAPVPADVISRLKAVLGAGGWSEDPERIAPKLIEWRDRWVGQTAFLALPRTTADVAAVVGICFEAGQPITTQGGNTGLVGGQIPQGEILLSTERMKGIREVDGFDDALTAEAGVTLAEVHAAAAEVRRRFPLGLASEGSATVGGVVSTNAGGTQVLRYGMTRNLVLGLEAVLPTGEVWNGLKRLRKDNTGYDLKQLLIGAEGTLGVVTAAALKLYPVMASRAVAMIGLGSPEDAIKLLARAKDETGGAVEAFELMGRLGVDFALRNIAGTRDPLSAPHPWYVLAEFSSGEPGSAEGAMERFLEQGLEAGLIRDAVVAQTDTQAKALWAIRENQSPAQKPEGATWKHDIAVPVSQVAAFLAQATTAMHAFAPGARIAAFGHVGDGNIHYDVLRADGGSDAEHAARRDAGSRIVHDIVASMGGSISAEHGLGAMKTAEGARYKSAVELAAQRAIRHALDPKRILNPRVLF
ncbi:MAG: FAD-binding oxidoreductase [Alphaproteobacteria bacterium]|nr:FAD-binding oxidoreductase [Alphaproteobacteria bacterium]MBU1515337.1 FAD-binding oxidoreductase [Alphaproteobacteria bacterium]MBU2095387.1 FAD-binding oxidoreductase [Alphaproteobacteria bacterium]MBU2152593.1 FAD-binding oxidoreductase [Alphaproteobacteria bacterium]MBU2309989.1 FAD-binding oxidoreductase [Alphaproteobacteria bacterium]